MMNYANQAIGVAPQQMNPLPNALSSMEYSIGQIENVVESLRVRLNSVMTPASPTPQTNASNQLAAAPAPVSDLTAGVCGYSRRIDSLSMVLGDMLSRLEV
jgi:hypothetical protein